MLTKRILDDRILLQLVTGLFEIVRKIIDPQTTLSDHSDRPVYLLDDPTPIKEVV